MEIHRYELWFWSAGSSVLGFPVATEVKHFEQKRRYQVHDPIVENELITFKTLEPSECEDSVFPKSNRWKVFQKERIRYTSEGYIESFYTRIHLHPVRSNYQE